MGSHEEVILFPFLSKLSLLLSPLTMTSVSQAAGGVFLTCPVLPRLLPQPPKAVHCGRAISSFLRPQRAKSAEAEGGKQANIFCAVWSPPFQRDVAQCNYSAGKSKSHYPSYVQEIQTTAKFIISPGSNSRHLCFGLWQHGQELKGI